MTDRRDRFALLEKVSHEIDSRLIDSQGIRVEYAAGKHQAVVVGRADFVDSSVDRGEPTQFAVNQVIPGWTEALQLMKVGSKWRLYIPAELAYGEMSPGAAIPPNSTLIFDVELLEIVKPEKTAASE